MSHSISRSLSVPFPPLVTLKSLLESPSNSINTNRQYRKVISSNNAVLSMNGKKDLAGQLSSSGLTGLSPAIATGTGQSGWPVDVNHFESAAAQAFLGPSIWDKSNPYDSMSGPGGSGHDFKLEYMDLDEFLSENGLGGGGQGTTSAGHGHGHGHGGHGSPLDSSCSSPNTLTMSGRAHLAGEDNKVTSSTGSKDRGDSPGDLNGPAHMMIGKEGMHMGPDIPGDFSMSPADLALATVPGSTHNFDPRRRRFSEEELKPQPMVKKSKKQFVPDDMKDEKYWARRRKNNLAAKRSRDARRVKENQIAIRASYLEKENAKLREQLDKLTRENMVLRDKLVTSVPKVDATKSSS